MKQSIAQLSLVVREYEEAIDFFVGKLGFDLIEDTDLPGEGKRWVIVAPPGSSGSRLLLAGRRRGAGHSCREPDRRSRLPVLAYR